MKTLYDMKLKYKFALVIAITFACIVTMGLSFKSLMNTKKDLQQTNTNARQIGKLYNQINEKFSEAGRSENNFLLKPSLDQVAVANNAILIVQKKSDELKTIAHDPEFSSIINEMESSIQQFSVLFKQLVDYKTQSGLDHNSGMNGKLRNAVHEVEDILKETNMLELSYSMLMMRRHEKDYLMRKLDKYVEKIQKEHKNFNRLLELSSLSHSDKQYISQKMDTYISIFLKLPPLELEVSRLINELHAVKILAESNVAKVDRFKRKSMAKGMAMVDEKSVAIAKRFYIIITISGLIIIGMLAALARGVLRPINNAAVVADSIASGNLDNTIESNSTNEVGQLLYSLNVMQSNIKERIEREAQVASINSRVSQALDNVSANVMVADPDGKIIYMNEAIKDMMRNVEPDMKKAIPSFDSGKLIGSNFDDFHANPSHQRKLLDNLKDTYVAEFPVGRLHMRIVANPIYGENNERLGTVAEWFDRTQQLGVEDEIQEIVNSAKSGDLSKRISLEGKDSFFERLSRGVNEMVDVSERAINDTVKAISAMSRGNLTETITAEYEGSFGQLKDDVNTTITKLTEVMGDITSSAHLVLGGSQEIAQGNTNLSQRTEQQASNLEETASSMEQMTSTVRQNADNATQANQLASGAREQAEQGGNVVNQAVSAMSEITDSSNKIADIIGVIDEIAFQTNLLALNAAVEAARAGEQGRGFAVVASEVRNLAGRSATAAKEIKDLIEDSVIKVEEGSKLVDASGQTLEEIMTSVKKVSDIIAEIAAASMEQSEGIEQVNKAISQMDEMTQQNAALVEEAAAASESMGEQAGNLNEMVGFFKTGTSITTPAATRPTFSGEDRRKNDRPWNKAASKAPALTAATASNTHPTTTDGGNEWDEF